VRRPRAVRDRYRHTGNEPRRAHPAIAPSALLLLLLSSCAVRSTPTPLPTPVVTPATARTTHGEEIRFALIGGVTTANVWSLFDSQGYTYNDYAVRAGYWPRLFSLSIPDEAFQPETASGPPSTFRREGTFFYATVPVRNDLHWSDRSAFTAQDVAFTVNTALRFGLGFDWHDSYNPEWLDHAEAPDPSAVKFFFKRLPDVGTWQYGALQGPIVQQAYWADKVAVAAALLPSADALPSMASLNAEISAVQARMNALYAQAVVAQAEDARQVQANLKREQGNLDEAMNNLAKAQVQFDQEMQKARAALYAADDSAEPRLGRWTADASASAASEGDVIVNEVSPDFPGVYPNFDRAAYHTFATRAEALAALEKSQVDVVLDPTARGEDGGSMPSMTSPDRDLRYVVFNLQHGPLQDASLRRALACLIDQTAFAVQAAALTSFIPTGEGPWTSSEVKLPCGGLDASARLTQAVQILQAAGYTWTTAPSQQRAGQGLRSPDAQPIAGVRLMAEAADELRMTAAKYVQQQAGTLGIQMTLQATTADVINYEVFSSGAYDAAVLGWKVGRYPGYLCEWFGPAKPFQYQPSTVTSLCGELEAAGDLETARAKVHEIESALAQDVPMIPLYSGVIREPYRNVGYPFTSVLDGLRGVYGAPGLAMPGSP